MTKLQEKKYRDLLFRLQDWRRKHRDTFRIYTEAQGWSLTEPGYTPDNEEGSKAVAWLNDHPDEVLKVLNKGFLETITELKEYWDITMELRKELANEKRGK